MEILTEVKEKCCIIIESKIKEIIKIHRLNKLKIINLN